jgi:N-carbamoylputrescine amidase
VKIALVQQHASHDAADNVQRGLQAVDEAARHGAHLVVFAELAFEHFHPQRPAESDSKALAQRVPGPITQAFAERARTHGLVIVLNLYERDGDRAFDCSPVIDADGRLLGRTRMVHITDYPCFHEQGYYAPGDMGAPVYETRAGRIGVAICYDRHYPEYMRALAVAGADLVVVPQAGALGEWPEGLFEAEMRVAAFQNGYFTALCNRVGKEDCVTFSGESFVCAPDGEVIARAPALEETILYADLDLSTAATSHARQLFLRDRRPELYEGWLGGAATLRGRDLVGNWELVSYETVDQNGRRGRPYGDAVGRLMYDSNGNMAGQVMRPNRSRVELGEGNAQQVRTAYMGYIAYFGTWEVVPDGRSVIHRVQGSLNPAWVGGDQIRGMRFDDGRLVLSADVKKGETVVTHTLTWKRC